MSKRLLVFVLIAVTCCGAIASAQILLVADQRVATVTLIDPAAGKTLATVAETIPGQWGHEITATSDGRTAFLPIYGNSGVGKPGIDGDKMLVIDVPSRKITGTVDFGHAVRPHLPVLDPVHGLLYVTTELDSAMTVIDPRTLKIVGKVPTGQKESHMLAISHDGRFGYTANVGPGTVSVLDLTERKTVAVIPIAGEVQRIAISRDDKWVFTSDSDQTPAGGHRHRSEGCEDLGALPATATAQPPPPMAIGSSLPSPQTTKSPSSICSPCA